MRGDLALDIEERKEEGAVVVCAVGRLDGVGAPRLLARVTAILGREEPRIVLDCAQITYISSAGLRALVICAKDCRQEGGEHRRASRVQRGGDGVRRKSVARDVRIGGYAAPTAPGYALGPRGRDGGRCDCCRRRTVRGPGAAGLSRAQPGSRDCVHRSERRPDPSRQRSSEAPLAHGAPSPSPSWRRCSARRGKIEPRPQAPWLDFPLPPG